MVIHVGSHLPPFPCCMEYIGIYLVYGHVQSLKRRHSIEGDWAKLGAPFWPIKIPNHGLLDAAWGGGGQIPVSQGHPEL